MGDWSWTGGGNDTWGRNMRATCFRGMLSKMEKLHGWYDLTFVGNHAGGSSGDSAVALVGDDAVRAAGGVVQASGSTGSRTALTAALVALYRQRKRRSIPKTMYQPHACTSNSSEGVA